MNLKNVQTFRFVYVVLDLFALNLVHFLMVIFLNKIPPTGQREYLLLFMAANVLWMFSALSAGLYVYTSDANGDRFAKKTLQTFLLFNLLMLCFMFIYHYQFSRLFMVLSFATFGVLLFLTRMTIIGYGFFVSRSSRSVKRVVIVGYNEIAKTLVSTFERQRKNYSVEGFFEESSAVTELSTRPIIGNIDACLEYAKANDIHEIYSTVSPENHRALYQMAKTAEKSFIRFKFVPDFKFYVNRKTHMEYLSEIPILSLRPEPLEDFGNALKKRFFDILFSLIIIIFILSWLAPIIALIIRLTSKGPIFFIQKRSGKNNLTFNCIKFRSLHVNKDANTIQVTQNDSRITPFGKFLRKSNLDELPQFFNVLKGDMSIVGPRPHMLTHTTSFSEIMEEYMLRHFVKPGVTGWAQVNGYRGEIKENSQLKKRLEYDIWYMENWSLYLDIKIIWLTIFSTIRGDKNAY